MKTAPYIKALCLLTAILVVFTSTSCKSDNVTSQNNPANKSGIENNTEKTSSALTASNDGKSRSENTLSTVKTVDGVTTIKVEPPQGSPQTDSFNLVTSEKVDLNGDGVKDSINLSHVKSHRPDPQEQTMFDLQINNASIQLSLIHISEPTRPY
jgi:hypothetical protein